MAERELEHLKIEGFYNSDPYKSPCSFTGARSRPRDQFSHGRKLQRHLQEIKQKFDSLKDVDLPEDIVREDAIYVEFISDTDLQPALERLHSDKQTQPYQLLSIKKEYLEENHFRYRVNVMLTEGGISHFIQKVNEYLTEQHVAKGEITDKPKNYRLFNNIEAIQLATLEAFWTEPAEVPFPGENEVVWWELWLRKKRLTETEEQTVTITNLRNVGGQVSPQVLSFPEHYVRLVKASPKQLADSVLLLDNLAELRKPRETADFFTQLSISEREEAVQDLQGRIEQVYDPESLAICIIDSGVNRQHPLISPFLPEENMFSFKPEEWGAFDSYPSGGHGTGVAGLCLYGDLTPLLASSENVQIYHQLESYKLFHHQQEHNPELYGVVTIEAANSPIISAPFRPRVYCMTLTAKDQAYYGRPSSWSAAVDKITFGNEEEEAEPQLFFISGGNVALTRAEEYPNKNTVESVHDPAQAFNAVTVGACTEMDRVDMDQFPQHELLAKKGGMAPSNSTSLTWENDWAVKPDIVMEGGNCLKKNNGLVSADSLHLLTTHKNFLHKPFLSFCDTSASTALAAHLAAQVKSQYPAFWPETIRGLIIHSADWTPEMMKGHSFKELQELKINEKRKILRSFGYGKPSLAKALYSAKNSLTLIAERVMQPFKKDRGEDVTFNETHLFTLPWPADVLQELAAHVDVRLNITLSYFIDPNPGSRSYSSKFSYQSHGLRFKVIKPGESVEDFQKRINKVAREEGENSGYSGEGWAISEQLRNKGSVHRDYWISSGADLATRNVIAVYPVGGWYRTRKRHEKYNSKIRYSLIVSIEAPEVEIDLYTPVQNKIAIEL